MERYFDVAIVGAGPAGLAAAITLKSNSPGTSVALFEKKRSLQKSSVPREMAGAICPT